MTTNVFLIWTGYMSLMFAIDGTKSQSTLPTFRDHINFMNLTLAGATETLAWAKMLPLHLEAKMTPWN